MLSIFKSDPTKKLKKQYSVKLEQAMQAQRKGDITRYSQLTFDAEEILKEIQRFESSTAT